MNSYPPELLAQLAPVMFVAGLEAQNPQSPTSPSTHLPQSPTPSTPGQKGQDPFTVLSIRLRDALSSQRKVAIWQPDKGKTFQIVLVDKEVQFPPRKMNPPTSEDGTPMTSTVTHSPLSPLTPASPLYPDGLIAPIWIRKHTTMVPSVFVLFLRIFELPPHNPRSPLDQVDPDKERERLEEERRRDTELAAEVALRKRSTNERGIKLTVVLMASRRMLDDPALDGRLTYIRRQSGLDSRAALFVLSPVSPSELADFVRSLQQALYEPALEYYTAHSKRVRRKRNRHSQTSAYMVPPSPLVTVARPLRPEGWTVRYEYKMACFAEFRSEDEVALKHYQDAYGMLLIMFGSTAILPPRTKRWAEAKVLADCINVKITKLYLYNNEHALALAQHSSHMRKFGDFSRGWGIGEETFEFWSWLARQHRVLSELLEHGLRGTFAIPNHKPMPMNSINPALLTAQIQAPSQRATNPLEVDALRSLGINPSHALQHPGFYYYMAARCTEMRRLQFLAAVEAEVTRKTTNSSPGFTNEKKVDHHVIILELYTKAYELFKKYTPVGPNNAAQGRLTLWIAYRIAQTYYDSGKFDMAVRFFERIAKTYRREQWDPMLRPLLSTWYACAQRLGDVELSIKLLIEMLGQDSEDAEDPSSLEEDLLAVLKSTVPSSTDAPLTIDLAEARPILTINVDFWSSEVKVNETAAFQLSLEAPKHTVISSLPIDSIAFYYSDDELPLVVRHAGSETDAPSVRRFDLGHVALGSQREPKQIGETSLRWKPGSVVVFSGTISSPTPTLLKISKVVLTIIEGTWKIEVPLDAKAPRLEPVAKWLCSLDPPKFIPLKRDNCTNATVRHRLHRIHVGVAHQAPAYLNEEYPINIEITNVDEEELDVSIDVLLQPTEVDEAVNSISLDGEHSSGLIRGIRCGKLLPGVSVFKTLYLHNTGAPGDRIVDISIRSRLVHGDEPEDEETQSQDVTETERTLAVETVDLIHVTQDVVYRHSTEDWLGPADMRTFDGDFWDSGKGGEAVVNVKLEFVGPWEVEVVKVEVQKQDNEHAKLIDSSIDHHGEDMFPAEFFPGDTLSEYCRVSLAPPEVENPDEEIEPIPGPGQLAVSWRRIPQNAERGPICTSTIPLPYLKPPTEALVALLSVPPIAKLHVPFTMTLTIRNYHPTRSANITIQLDADAQDAFVAAGLKSGRLPIMLPGGEEKIRYRLVPMECGYCKLPTVKVKDARNTIQVGPVAMDAQDEEEEVVRGELVKVVDVRVDIRQEQLAIPGDGIDGAPAAGDDELGPGTVLVLPC
ncbi:hypothetical protein BDN72DRAFT_812681 [Pluteus cervinus]|uniref:Uncharacterized protein n=1 Tax=Pluteus cervinus TaxID=181527 RepID=A0ACD3BAS5_9AGAR|nr:hypothetical protein BDN72DRAFT_812681 [Pluteus cervinus]